MFKRYAWLLGVLLLALAVWFVKTINKPADVISEDGIYRMVTQSENDLSPCIYFYNSGNSQRFRSAMDMRISLSTDGTAHMQDGKMYTVSDDGKQKWVFKVQDRQTLIFKADESTVPQDSEGKPLILDGAEFKYEKR